MEKIEYIRDLDTTVGISNDYFFRMKRESKQNVGNLEFFVKNVDMGLLKSLMRDIHAMHRGFGKRVKKSKHGVLVPVNLNKMDPDTEFKDVVDRITLFLKENNGTQTSELSGATAGLDLYRVDDEVLLATSDEYESKILKEGKFYNNKGNPLLGYLGALSGIAIGMAVWVLVSYFLNLIAAFAGLLIVAFGYTGYEKFGGRQTRISAIIVFLMAIAGVVLAELIATALAMQAMYSDMGYSFTFLETLFELLPIAFENEYIVAEVGKNIVLGVIFTMVAGVGMVGSTFKSLKKEFIAYPLFQEEESLLDE